jgi:ribokinase
MKKIVVVGSINMDYTALVKTLPQPGETLLASSFKMSGGGKGANQAIAAAVFSPDVQMIGMVGDDPAGHALYDKLKDKGLDVSSVGFCNTPTGNALISVAEHGKNMIVVYPGANSEVKPHIIKHYREAIRSASLVVLQLEIPMESVELAAQLAFEAKVPVLLNPAPAAPLSEELLKHITYLTPNETELAKLTGTNDIELGTVLLRNKGVKNIIVTLGADGCYVHTDKWDGRVPTFKVNAVDTTAAGDAFNGALAVAISEGKGMKEALRIANATGSLTTTRHGAQEAIPSREEVEALLNT